MGPHKTVTKKSHMCKCNMNLRRLILLSIEIHKRLNSSNPKFTKDIFHVKKSNGVTSDIYNLNSKIPRRNHLYLLFVIISSSFLVILTKV